MTPEAIEHTPRTQPLEVSLQRLASLLSGNSIGTGELAALRRLNPKDSEYERRRLVRRSLARRT